jgi:hypothetical protein
VTVFFVAAYITCIFTILFLTLKTEAASYSETLISTYKSIRYHNKEYNNMNIIQTSRSSLDDQGVERWRDAETMHAGILFILYTFCSLPGAIVFHTSFFQRRLFCWVL